MVEVKRVQGNNLSPNETTRKISTYMHFPNRTKIAFFLLICLLIAPTVGFVAAEDYGPKINGKIAFQSDRDGNFEIYVMNADGSGQMNLSNNNS